MYFTFLPATVLGVIQETKRGEKERKGFVAFGDPSFVNARQDQVATRTADSQSERRMDLSQLPYAPK